MGLSALRTRWRVTGPGWLELKCVKTGSLITVFGNTSKNDCNCDSFYGFVFLAFFILMCFVFLSGTSCYLSWGFPMIKQENTVYFLVQPITVLPFIKLLLLMMCYLVPVLVLLGCIQFEVLLVIIVAERMLVWA